jgi:hypothetical protein
VLASYQSLLAADYLVGNLIRQEVLLDGEQLIALEGNDAFSARGKDGAVGDALGRLSRHLVYSQSLSERLAKLDATAIERALRGGPDRALLVTPKQLGEVVDRARTLDRLIAVRVRQRGREHALALP